MRTCPSRRSLVTAAARRVSRPPEERSTAADPPEPPADRRTDDPPCDRELSPARNDRPCALGVLSHNAVALPSTRSRIPRRAHRRREAAPTRARRSARETSAAYLPSSGRRWHWRLAAALRFLPGLHALQTLRWAMAGTGYREPSRRRVRKPTQGAAPSMVLIVRSCACQVVSVRVSEYRDFCRAVGHLCGSSKLAAGLN